MTKWMGNMKGDENTYPHLSSVRDKFIENGDTVHAAICDAALSLIKEQALAIHRLRDSMRVLSCLNPNIENDVDNPWLVATQVNRYVIERIAGLESLVDAKGKMYDEILSASVKTVNELREALLPFAAIADESTANLADNYMYSDCFPMSAFRAASAAIEKK
jgi:hypothetical protein